MGIRIAVSVSNDLSTDQRVRKQCSSMYSAGYDVLLTGRRLPDSLPIERPYALKRMRLLFNKKALFYAELNIRLFFRLLFARVQLLYANDLDTLPANALVAWMRRLPLVYDSHEYFTEVPEIQHRPKVKAVWKWLERTCIRQADVVLTVNESIAGMLKQSYQLPEVLVVRNVPERQVAAEEVPGAELNLPKGRHLMVLQGSGINVDRGAEELFEALALLEGVCLLVIGSGDALPRLKSRAEAADLQGKVIFKPRMPYPDMMRYTAACQLGLSLDKDTNVNYRYSLPNKVFDYIAAGVPVLASNLPEVRRLIESTDTGVIAEQHDPAYLAELIHATLHDAEALKRYRRNALKAAPTLQWQHEYAPVVEAMGRLVQA